MTWTNVSPTVPNLPSNDEITRFDGTFNSVFITIYTFMCEAEKLIITDLTVNMNFVT